MVYAVLQGSAIVGQYASRELINAGAVVGMT